MLDRLVHGEPLRRRLLAGDDHVHIISASQAVVGHREQRVGVRRQIDADDLRLLVHDVVDEARILVAKAVVILPPDVRAEQVIERADRPPPANVVADLQPLGVLIEHRVDDVDERLVARKEPVPAGEQISFEPALALMLAEHFHHTAVGAEMIVLGIDLGHVTAVGHFQHVLPAVRVILVGAEEAEVLALQILLHDVAEELAHHPRRFGRRTLRGSAHRLHTPDSRAS